LGTQTISTPLSIPESLLKSPAHTLHSMLGGQDHPLGSNIHGFPVNDPIIYLVKPPPPCHNIALSLGQPRVEKRLVMGGSPVLAPGSVSFNSGFLSVYAQQWDCWIIWQFYFQFFKESPHCSP